jgi:SET domain-containing protein
MKLEKLLNELAYNTYAMLKPSKIHGIGVFAIKDIPKGCKTIFSEPNLKDDEYIAVSKTSIEKLPKSAIALIENFCLYDDENYFVPEKGFKKLDLAIYLNHSENPNLISINDGDYFETLRDIKAGEELLIDYGAIV